MKTLFKGIGYRSSDSDRVVLKWLLMVSCLLATAIGVGILLVVLPSVWNPQAGRDSATLDLILSTQFIDRVEFMSPYRTNFITGAEAQKLVASLHRTNRIPNVDWTKQEVENVKLLSGTNETWLSLGKDGSWEFREYGFRIRPQ